jgi:hypothetical protein
LVERWHPRHEIVAVADSTYASLKFLGRCRRLSDPVSFIVRLRLDAALYELASLRKPGQVEATFQEARRYLEVETQRQWSELAIRRTMPALLSLFSLITLFAHQRMVQGPGVLRQAAAYRANPTRPSPMRWRWYGESCGRKGLLAGRTEKWTR